MAKEAYEKEKMLSRNYVKITRRRTPKLAKCSEYLCCEESYSCHQTHWFGYVFAKLCQLCLQLEQSISQRQSPPKPYSLIRWITLFAKWRDAIRRNGERTQWVVYRGQCDLLTCDFILFKLLILTCCWFCSYGTRKLTSINRITRIFLL